MRRFRVHFHRRQVVRRVFGDELAGFKVPLPHLDPNFRAVFHDVGVGENVPLVRDEYARARRARVRRRLLGLRAWRGLRLWSWRSCRFKRNRSSRGSISIKGFDLPFLDAENVGLATLPQPPKRNSDFIGIRPSTGRLQVSVSGRDEVIQLGQFGRAANGELVRIASLAAIEARALCIASGGEATTTIPAKASIQD